MEDLKEKLTSRLKEIEDNLHIYNAFLADPNTDKEEKKAVNFRVFYDMMSFESLRSFVPEYQSTMETAFLLARGLQGAADYVTVQGGKVVISPDYKTVLEQKENYLKSKNKN